MGSLVLHACIEIATAAAVLRSMLVLRALVQMLFKRLPTRSLEWDWSVMVTAPEPFLLPVAVYLLRRDVVFASVVSAPYLVLTIAGAIFSLLGLAISFWAFYSYPNVGTGHYMDADHQIVTRGAYGFVRHPIYLGVFLIWFGLAFAYGSTLVLAVAALYVVPAYTVYVRSEEAMLAARVGPEYLAYKRRVPGFVPRLSRAPERGAD